MPTDVFAVETEELVVGYGGSPVVKGVSFRARSGEVTVIVGPNGAGKSTLLKGMAGMARVTSGGLRFEGEDVTGQPAHVLARRGLGYVPQSGHVFPTLTVAENLDLGAYSQRKTRKEQMAVVCELFPVLERAFNRSAWMLSGGEQRMLGLGRALMARPRILLLDEPTGGLSPLIRHHMWEHVARTRDLGLALVVVEQNTKEALTKSDSAYVLSFGEVKLAGSSSEVLAHPDLVGLYLGHGDEVRKAE